MEPGTAYSRSSTNEKERSPKKRVTRSIIKSLLLTTALALLASCATTDIPDIYTYVTLPVSGDGHGITTLSHQQVRIPKEQWDEIKKRGIILFSEDWARIKHTLAKNCLSNQCKQSIGALDSLFYAIDDALKKIPTNR